MRDLSAMHAQIPHRGPDGEAFLVLGSDNCAHRGERLESLFEHSPSPRLGLAFRWLAVQDRSRESIQPMVSRNGRHWIVFNGEIYNFPELRAELETEGHRFRTHVDTEVILAAYERWGTECFRRFRGMWAILIADTERRKLIGCRDRFGIKPLFYATEGERILFASEIKSILAALGTVGIHEPFLYEYLHGHRSHATEETYYSNVLSVPAASMFEIDLTAPSLPPLRFERWWRLRQSTRPKQSYDDAIRELDERLRDAMRVHLRADVKVGTFLSGGLDSAVITGIVRNDSSVPHDAYSLVFDRARYAAIDESQYVDDFVRSTGVENFRTTMTPTWVAETVPRLTWTQEEPLMASTLCAQHRVFALARERGATVVLDGQGSDEIFGGYAKHEAIVWRERLLRGHFIQFAREARVLSSTYRASIPSLIFGSIVRPAGGKIVRAVGIPYRRYRWIDESAVSRRRMTSQPAEERDEIASWRSHFDREMITDLRYGTLRPLFLYSDRSGMSHSVEARLPYLDHPLVEYAVHLPAEWKVGFGIRKRILRDVARRYVPSSIIERKDKLGFAAPEAEWLRNEMRDQLREAAASPFLSRLPVLRHHRVREFIDAYIGGRHSDFRAVWRLYALRHWLEVYHLA